MRIYSFLIPSGNATPTRIEGFFVARPSWLRGRQASCLSKKRRRDARWSHRLEACAPFSCESFEVAPRDLSVRAGLAFSLGMTGRKDRP